MTYYLGHAMRAKDLESPDVSEQREGGTGCFQHVARAKDLKSMMYCDSLWQIITRGLPPLIAQLERMLSFQQGEQ